jgi:hypothetical protein
MELSGEEKKLQALFSELKAAEEQATPHFGATWNRAQLAPRRLRAFNSAFVAGTSLLVFGVAAFAILSRYPRTASAPQPAVAEARPSPAIAAAVEPSPAAVKDTPVPRRKSTVIAARRSRTAHQRNAMIAANRKLQKNAKSIANWTSPTSTWLESPSDEMFSSLPELNQSATQLKSFLPNRAN